MKQRGLLATLAVALVPCVAAPAAQGTRTPLARVELTGPLERVELSLPGGGTTVALPLRAGERRTLTLPLPTPAPTLASEPGIRVDGAGAARFLGWVGSDLERLAGQWERLPAGLRLRPRPPAPEQPLASGPPVPALLVACAGFLLALRWRRRGALVLGIGALTGASAYALAAPSPPQGRELRLLEGDGGGDVWLEVRVARERLVVRPADALWVETRPAGASLRARVDQDGQGLRWVLLAPGATVYALEAASFPAEALTRGGTNRLGGLAETWLREPDGSWTRRGAWPSGEPLPAALPGPGEPPGWINPALPMGTAVLIGRREDAGPRGAQAWVRLVGLQGAGD